MNMLSRTAIIVTGAGLLALATRASADLEITPDGVAVYDTVTDTYWLRDLSTFDHLSYDDQIAAIAAFEGNWKMAELEDIEAMDANPDGDIHDAFLPTAASSVDGVSVDIYFGRVDFDFGGGIHMIAHMSWDTDNDVLFSELTYLGNGGSDEGPGPDGQGGFAAWVVHIGEYGVPSCDADVDGDGDIGVGDLTEVLLSWGDTFGAADINMDGIVDVFDLIEVILNWGPCGG